jgi:ATP-dependent Zn protease
MSLPPTLDYSQSQPRARLGRGLLAWVIFILVAIFLFFWLKQATPGVPAVAISDFYMQLKAGNVAAIDVDTDEIDGNLRRPVMINGATVVRFRTYLPQGTGSGWRFTQSLLDASPGTLIRAEPSNNFLTNFILPFIPWLLILAFIWFFVFRQLRRGNAGRQPMPVVIVNPEAR